MCLCMCMCIHVYVCVFLSSSINMFVCLSIHLETRFSGNSIRKKLLDPKFLAAPGVQILLHSQSLSYCWINSDALSQETVVDCLQQTLSWEFETDLMSWAVKTVKRNIISKNWFKTSLTYYDYITLCMYMFVSACFVA